MAKFALLSYVSKNQNNLGDEIQSIAVRRFLPRVDVMIDREELDTFEASEPHHIVLNGWYMHRPERWPPSGALKPLITSFHITQRERAAPFERADRLMLRGAGREYLAAHAPIGARDRNTQRLLESAGIESYFSGCATLTLPQIEAVKRDQVAAVQLPGPAMRALRWRCRSRIVKATHRDRTPGAEVRFGLARSRLELYAACKAVVTDRLHCALPCLAMGVPILFVNTAPDPYRFDGLRELLHWVELSDFLDGRYDYDLNDPPPNKDAHLPLRTAMEERLTAFVRAADAGQ